MVKSVILSIKFDDHTKKSKLKRERNRVTYKFMYFMILMNIYYINVISILRLYIIKINIMLQSTELSRHITGTTGFPTGTSFAGL